MLQVVVEMRIDDHVRVGQESSFVEIAVDLWTNISFKYKCIFFFFGSEPTYILGDLERSYRLRPHVQPGVAQSLLRVRYEARRPVLPQPEEVNPVLLAHSPRQQYGMSFPSIPLGLPVQHLLLLGLLLLELDAHLAREILSLFTGRRLRKDGHLVRLGIEASVVVQLAQVWWRHYLPEIAQMTLLPGDLLGQWTMVLSIGFNINGLGIRTALLGIDFGLGGAATKTRTLYWSGNIYVVYQ